MVMACNCGLAVQNMKVISKRTKGTAQDDTSGKMKRYRIAGIFRGYKFSRKCH